MENEERLSRLKEELDSISEIILQDNPDEPTEQLRLLSMLNVYLARCNMIYVEAKQLYSISVGKLCDSKIISSMPPSIASQFIKAACNKEESLVFYAERLDRTIVHICDNLRTQISYAKEQMRLAGT